MTFIAQTRSWLALLTIGAVSLAACGDDDSADTSSAATSVATTGTDAAAAATSSPGGTDATSPQADPDGPETTIAETEPPETQSSEGSGSGWSFTDDTGQTITLDEPPKVIASSTVVAGTLWEYGIEVDAAYGPLRYENGKPDPQLGLADPDAFESLGEVWGEINLEKLAALDPDVIIGAMWGGEESLESHPQWRQMQQIAPHIHIEVVDTDFETIPERFAELALALGADESTVDEGRTEFEAASRELEETAADRDDISTSFVSASSDLLYLGVIEGFTDLRYFDEIGLDIVQQPPTDMTIGGVVYWTELSAELVDRASADVIFVDSRAYADIATLLDEQPTWMALPARAAEQIGAWDVEPGYGYRNLARILSDMTSAIGSAEDVVG